MIAGEVFRAGEKSECRWHAVPGGGGAAPAPRPLAKRAPRSAPAASCAIPPERISSKYSCGHGGLNRQTAAPAAAAPFCGDLCLKAPCRLAACRPRIWTESYGASATVLGEPRPRFPARRRTAFWHDSAAPPHRRTASPTKGQCTARRGGRRAPDSRVSKAVRSRPLPAPHASSLQHTPCRAAKHGYGRAAAWGSGRRQQNREKGELERGATW